MLEYRKLHTFTSLFTKPFRLLHINGLLHSSYKQTVKTGRMACSTPNMQQCMSWAKELIVCDEDEVIISADYSQIEFRVIVHYIQDAAAIAAYAADPFTDFHEWVAKVCNIHRKPAKTVNFLMGYGGGESRLVNQLMQVVELVGGILEAVEKLDLPDSEKKKRFAELAKLRGTEVYNTYHETLPGLKRTSRVACNRVYDRGYCVNKYGRRRHLPPQVAWRAFNTVCQGTAADLMKERLVALWKWLKKDHPEFQLIGVVHDEVVIRGPKALVTDNMLDQICFILEDISVQLRVPIRTSLGVSESNWLDASNKGQNRLFDREKFKLCQIGDTSEPQISI
jgi:DNA polymerase-1